MGPVAFFSLRDRVIGFEILFIVKYANKATDTSQEFRGIFTSDMWIWKNVISVTWPIRLMWVFQKLPMSWDFHTWQSLEFTQKGVKNNNLRGVTVLWVEMHCWWGRSEKNGQTGLSWKEVYSNSTNYSLQLFWTEKHFTPWTLRLDGWTGSEQESEATVYTDSNLDSGRLEKNHMVWWIATPTATCRWKGQKLP